MKRSASFKMQHPLIGPYTCENFRLLRLEPTSMCFQRASPIRSIVVTSRAGHFSHRHVPDVTLPTLMALPLCELGTLVSASEKAMPMLLKCIRSTQKPSPVGNCSRLRAVTIIFNLTLRCLGRVKVQWRNVHIPHMGCQPRPCVCAMHLQSCIAVYFAYASAWEFSKRARCCETRLVVAPQPSANFQAEACPE